MERSLISAPKQRNRLATKRRARAMNCEFRGPMALCPLQSLKTGLTQKGLGKNGSYPSFFGHF
jgi:hypothetical protein